MYRRIEGPNGEVLFETIDYAKFEGTGADARVVTASYPFTGYKDGWNRWNPTGGGSSASLGFGDRQHGHVPRHRHVDAQRAAALAAPIGGVIYGTVVRPEFEPGLGDAGLRGRRPRQSLARGSSPSEAPSN